MTLSRIDRRMVEEVRRTGQKLYAAKHHTQSTHVLSAAMAYIRSVAASALQCDPYGITWKQIASVFKEVPQDMVLLGEMHLDRTRDRTAPQYEEQYDLAFGGMLASMVRRCSDCNGGSLALSGSSNGGVCSCPQYILCLCLPETILSAVEERGAPVAAYKFILMTAVCAVLQAATRALDVTSVLLQADSTCCTQDRMKVARQGFVHLLTGAFIAGNIMEACRAMGILNRSEVQAIPLLPGYDARQQDYRQGSEPVC